MRSFRNVLAVGLVGVVLVAGPARGAAARLQAATSAAQVDDGTLTSRITANLKRNAAIAARDIDVEVHEGIVTLKGAVGTAGEKARAARLATIRGVTEVRNEIVVDAVAAKSRTAKAMDATEQAGEKTKEVASAAGEAITDGWITTKVKAKFFDETLLQGSDIHVDTNDRVVT